MKRFIPRKKRDRGIHKVRGFSESHFVQIVEIPSDLDRARFVEAEGYVVYALDLSLDPPSGLTVFKSEL
jgi:hypothetical protein